MDFKIDLKKYRVEKGLSQQQLADLLGVSQQHISEFEKGNRVPNVERLVQMAQVLKIGLDDLVKYEKAHDAYSRRLAEKFYKKDNDDSKKSDE